MHGERRLAEPAHAVDGADRDPPAWGLQQAQKFVHLGAAAGEIRHVGGKLVQRGGQGSLQEAIDRGGAQSAGQDDVAIAQDVSIAGDDGQILSVARDRHRAFAGGNLDMAYGHHVSGGGARRPHRRNGRPVRGGNDGRCGPAQKPAERSL